MRLLIVQRIILAGLLFIWGGLFYVQILQGREFRQAAEKNRTRLVHLPAARGPILDRHGVPLVEDRVSFELAVFPQELKSPRESWERLSPFVGLSPEELARRYRRDYSGPFAPVTLVRDIPAQTAFLLEENRAQLSGLLVRPVPRRHYLLGAALGPVAGYLGLIAPEELTHLKPYGYTFRDLVGKDGLESAYDRILRGQDGGLQVEVDVRGRMVRQMGFRQPQAGRGITVSLDGRLQSYCYRLLEEWAGAILVMDPATGEILALVSSPTFDPNAFVDPDRKGEVLHLLHQPVRPMFNRAFRSAVPPGSTFKVAVAYAALEGRKIGPDTSFHCSGSLLLGNALFRCWWKEGHGPQTVSQALERSCNVFFYQTGRRLQADGIARAAHLFGLGRPTGIDLPRESGGLVPDPGWMRAVLQQPWREGDTLSFAIGQGALAVTPLQMLLLDTAIAMEGEVPRPHLLIGIPGEPRIDPPRKAHIPLDKGALSKVKEGMERVVASETGTGRLARLPGIEAAAKTGTAQVSRGTAHAWFIGYAPKDHPKVTFAVFLEHGGKGGGEAALVARDLLAYLKELEYL
ncbi:MAG: penicillin-binding protein 2 [Candidatus Omnitrophica bacterium]|nr:penicillin-binding protein 2 [Candidatus Omnitrophota bacterium]